MILIVLQSFSNVKDSFLFLTGSVINLGFNFGEVVMRLGGYNGNEGEEEGQVK